MTTAQETKLQQTETDAVVGCLFSRHCTRGSRGSPCIVIIIDPRRWGMDELEKLHQPT